MNGRSPGREEQTRDQGSERENGRAPSTGRREPGGDDHVVRGEALAGDARAQIRRACARLEEGLARYAVRA